jgi:predicted DNA binding CopG/RHH family protein
MKKKSIPPLKTDKAAENFLRQDLSDYLHAENFASASFEFLPKTENINLRVPAPLLKAIKQRAKRVSMPYQRYIRHILEREVRD